MDTLIELYFFHTSIIMDFHMTQTRCIVYVHIPYPQQLQYNIFVQNKNTCIIIIGIYTSIYTSKMYVIQEHFFVTLTQPHTVSSYITLELLRFLGNNDDDEPGVCAGHVFSAALRNAAAQLSTAKYLRNMLFMLLLCCVFFYPSKRHERPL